jgi:hypothetical protein
MRAVTDTTPKRPELSYDLRIPGKRRRKAIQVITEALVTHSGNAVWAAAELGVPHRTVLRWCDRHPELRAARVRAQRGIATQVLHRQDDETVIAKDTANEG